MDPVVKPRDDTVFFDPYNTPLLVLAFFQLYYLNAPSD
ncbi:MAG: hypothetical protein ACEY3D_09075 [Rickettsia sp.]